MKGRVAVIAVVAALCGAALVASVTVMPAVAAGALVHRSRTPLYRARPASCRDATWTFADVVLQGWRCSHGGPERRGTIVYLHGIGDNRSGGAGVVDRFGPRGFDVVAYDSRAHGASSGDLCTYGVRERDDLRRVIATIASGPVVLIGGSLGAAVALQTAAIEPRVSGVVAAEVFSDLRSVASERGRRMWLPPWVIARALAQAETRLGFDIDSASPVEAARHVTAPVLLLHGDRDAETASSHSQRVRVALGGPRTLIMVPGVGHNQTLPAPGVWDRVARWIDASVTTRPDVR